ncbi:MAG: hypothetical protein KDD69_19105, partial [Bdellovibrionales bacterium]|nr:hypothetical protein [Bdellovibrionales bacterium]
MALEIKLNQKLSQTLVMTPQLQQAIKLLQLGRQEYVEVLERELLENPVLEDSREDEEQFGARGTDTELPPVAERATPSADSDDIEIRRSNDDSLGDLFGYSAARGSGSG